MKKIAVLCSTDFYSYPVGGMMSFVKDIAPELALCFDVDFWGVDAGSGVQSFSSGGSVFPVRHFGSVKTDRKILPNSLRVTWQLWTNRKKLLAGGYDAIYIHGIPLNAALPRRGRGPKRINHVHGLNNPFNSLGKVSIGRKLLFFLYDALRQHALRQSDLVFLAADRQGVGPFIARFPTAAKIVPLPNFCDTSVFSTMVEAADRPAAGLTSKDRIILFVGRQSAEKDPILALKILKALKLSNSHNIPIKLVMIGAGPLQGEVEATVDRLGIKADVRLLGGQSREQIARWMRAADVLLLTSHFEGFPVVLAEAAHCGLPMVCPKITGVHDLVETGENGHIVDSRSPDDFVEPILDTLVNRTRYGARSLELAEQCTSDSVLQRLCKELQGVI